MGFDSYLVVAGLRQTDNDSTATITLLTQNPELLREAIAKERRPAAAPLFSEDKISQITFLGYTREQAIAALERTHGDVQAAMTDLLTGGSGSADKPAAAGGDEAMTEVTNACKLSLFSFSHSHLIL